MTHKFNITVCGILIILLLIVMELACDFSPKSAQKAATERFRSDLIEADISESLFLGPVLARNDLNEIAFQWASTVPESGATIIEISISKVYPGGVGSLIKGPRNEPLYLTSTRKMPFGKAILTTLFSLTSDTSDHSIFVEPLREIQLTKAQLSDVASFVQIKISLKEYEYYIKHCPDSLEIFHFDSLFTHDHWGNKYFYKNLGNMVILGTPGKNEKWEFNKAAMDSLYNYPWQQIYTTDDDIVVRFWP
jgi:hypothetical protein